ncbi:CRP-like cAMP-binding protein [Clostridium acetobutylicum]|uniref:FNR-like catabolite gene activator (C-AMP binding domain) n=2 Tax=Clostridium acetobutylicum (strain ATCC 824 / DSM 792 / JCM 1419 / IAM 19013 / LMG 5710 / NBRC 13948 / NRRL B-527 / VKM B-1787 / 2291 / W) TaxID=272562 RepID=Q97IX9_CLOAB|nr:MULTISPECIES: Crp/Fnr family transcriptional regulator [Clostridium]AAK79478.1 FNR-like catabolite gene activator (c-AMP binding domain) [Clostridium acetobutylicum ATCC 824]ADZ20563.1 FNR-like catabolite gene activator (c-AMP binding domain) [Clostridium acetobutylicum EA 2018]AEI33546.1 FNR-like catabolite activator protein [Clostridium acetobutylicum DSM 1731]AWV81277.1 Crp/Fnr family transcriptional regulator [Clostridium acetobutylicum]MBC2392911.1 Crp/Fnr family transcriptional regula
MELKEAFKEVEVLQNVSLDTLKLLENYGSLKRIKKGEHIFRDKDQVSVIYIVIEGLAALYKINSVGEKKVIFVFGKGKMLNEVIFQEMFASVNCEVLEDALILCFSKNKLIKVMEKDFELTKAVMNSMAIKIRRLYRQLKNTTNSIRGDKKIAAKLWKLSGDYGIKVKEGTKINMELSITYLADMLGSKRETVSRQLKLLTEKNLVILKKNEFIIPNREKIKNYFKAP